MKKLLILVGLLILTTGCEINYNLEIGEDGVVETTSLVSSYADDDDYVDQNSEMYDIYVNKPIPVFKDNTVKNDNKKESGIKYYTTKDLATDDELGIELSTEFDYSSAINSKLANYVYDDFSVKKNNNLISVAASKIGYDIFKEYPTIKKINVNVKTPYTVVDNNADKVKDDVYTWTLKKSNYKEKDISITMDTTQVIEKSKGLSGGVIAGIVILVIIVVLGIGITIYIAMRYRQNSQF